MDYQVSINTFHQPFIELGSKSVAHTMTKIRNRNGTKDNNRVNEEYTTSTRVVQKTEISYRSVAP
jgi:hypothetical protein